MGFARAVLELKKLWPLAEGSLGFHLGPPARRKFHIRGFAHRRRASRGPAFLPARPKNRKAQRRYAVEPFL